MKIRLMEVDKINGSGNAPALQQLIITGYQKFSLFPYIYGAPLDEVVMV